jgi:hypothetical protein
VPGRCGYSPLTLAINQGCRSPTGSAMLGLERGDAGDEVLAGERGGPGHHSMKG